MDLFTLEDRSFSSFEFVNSELNKKRSDDDVNTAISTFFIQKASCYFYNFLFRFV